jgi:hypothetical protein
VVHAGDTDLPESVLFPAVTRARELFEAGEAITDPARLRLVIDLPADLNQLAIGERRAVERFLRRASRAGVPDGYIAAHRRPWWAVGLPNPAPILATYMARRPPAFVLNRAGARHINVAHGLYPRIELGDEGLAALARALGEVTRTDQGRTYAGGLTKFEPREMERIMVPGPDLLRAA